MEWLGQNSIPFSIIFTKADKLKPKAMERNVNDYLAELVKGVWEEAPAYFVTSSSKGVGRNELLDYIDTINIEFFKATKA